MRPVIGISSSMDEDRSRPRVSTGYSYVRAVNDQGGMGIVLPVVSGDGLPEAYIAKIDGLILSGGRDVDPAFYGEQPIEELGQIEPQRDRCELKLTELALKRGLPVLAICRGIQVLNVAAGGSLYQDLPTQVDGAIKHSQDAPRWALTHGIEVDDSSLLHQSLGKNELRVNSFHHQAVREPAPSFRVSARSADGVVEAIENNDMPFVLGVQFHPEDLFKRHPVFASLFEAFVRAAFVSSSKRGRDE